MRTIISLLFLTLTTLTFGQTKENYKIYYDSLLLRGQYDELVVFFEKELVKYPNSEDILRRLGFVYKAKDSLDLGEKYYNEALVVNPNCARCYMNIASIYLQRKQYIKALEYANVAITLDSNDASLYSYRAFIKEKLLDTIGAIADHDMALKIEPKNPDFYIYRGEFYSRFKYPTIAILDYSKAISLNDTNYLPYFYRALTYNSLKEFDLSCSDLYFLKSLIDNEKINNKSDIAVINLYISDYCDSLKARYYYERGYVFYNADMFKHAIDIYDQGLKKFSTNGMILSYKGDALFALNQYDQAIEVYTLSLKHKKRILSEIRNNPWFCNITEVEILRFYNIEIASIYYKLSQCYSNIGNYDLALKKINKAINLVEDLVQDNPEYKYEDYYYYRRYIILKIGK